MQLGGLKQYSEAVPGIHPNYSSINKDTLLAMGKVGLRILRSELDLDRFSYACKKTENATGNEDCIRFTVWHRLLHSKVLGITGY
jgi:hypothetical protein